MYRALTPNGPSIHAMTPTSSRHVIPIAPDLVIPHDFSSDIAADFLDRVPDGTPVAPASPVLLCESPVSCEPPEPRETSEMMNQMTAGSASRQIGDNATMPPTVGSAMTFLLWIRNARGFVPSVAKTFAVNGKLRVNLIGANNSKTALNNRACGLT
ncbi:hypothetical protein [Bifidobacterium boum]|uniref:hypothetical protein n=1 Tax=Bifidobacterium boum TaxID=78343 RepID=UPI00197C8652|nr:hypothetical protein [Bifidobacterium boum]